MKRRLTFRFYENLAQFKMQNSFQKIPQKKVLDSLVPVDNVDDKFAFDALDEALDFNNEMIHNIAISGPFGAGKTSLWRSYKEKRLKNVVVEDRLANPKGYGRELPGYDSILEISLAKFEDSSSDGNCSKSEQNDDSVNEKRELQVEEAILQQILFSVEREDVPRLSHFKLSSKESIVAFIFACLSFAIIFFVAYSYVSIDFFDQYLKFVNHEVPFKGDDSFLQFVNCLIRILLFAASIVVSRYVYKLICNMSNFRIGSFGVNGFDLTIEDGKDSLINKNYAGIVYFFEKTAKRVVVFEDIDRFSSNRIFVKLRELNGLLNNCPMLKNKIKFVYMVKENLFSKYERTKFFDSIIPVVPIVNMDSCADYLMQKKQEDIEKFEEMKNEEDAEIECILKNVSSKLLRIVGNHVNDLRIIKECLNEFKIYKVLLKESLKSCQTEIDSVDDKIFAMVVYKNYYPKDFEYLHRHKGFLYDICFAYNYGGIVEYDSLIQDEGKISLAASCKDYEENGFGQWVFNQCLKLDLKLNVSDDLESCVKKRTKDGEKIRRTSLLFDLLKTGFIDKNCEFYVSRKHNGDLTPDDYAYLIGILSNLPTNFNLQITKPDVLEQKIFDEQWTETCVLNYRMVAYILYTRYMVNTSSTNQEKKDHFNQICKNLLSAIGKDKNGFFNGFVRYSYENRLRRAKIKLDDGLFVIAHEGDDCVNVKNLFYEFILENMKDSTLLNIFGER